MRYNLPFLCLYKLEFFTKGCHIWLKLAKLFSGGGSEMLTTTTNNAQILLKFFTHLCQIVKKNVSKNKFMKIPQSKTIPFNYLSGIMKFSDQKKSKTSYLQDFRKLYLNRNISLTRTKDMFFVRGEEGGTMSTRMTFLPISANFLPSL